MILQSISVYNFQFSDKRKRNLTTDTIPLCICWASHTSVSIFEEFGLTHTLSSIPKLVGIFTCLNMNIIAGQSIEECTIRAFLTSTFNDEVTKFTSAMRSIIVFIWTTSSCRIENAWGSEQVVDVSLSAIFVIWRVVPIVVALESIPVSVVRTLLAHVGSHWMVSLMADTWVGDNVESGVRRTFGNGGCWSHTLAMFPHISIVTFAVSPTPILVLSTTFDVFTTTSNPWKRSFTFTSSGDGIIDMVDIGTREFLALTIDWRIAIVAETNSIYILSVFGTVCTDSIDDFVSRRALAHSIDSDLIAWASRHADAMVDISLETHHTNAFTIDENFIMPSTDWSAFSSDRFPFEAGRTFDRDTWTINSLVVTIYTSTFSIYSFFKYATWRVACSIFISFIILRTNTLIILPYFI